MVTAAREYFGWFAECTATPPGYPEGMELILHFSTYSPSYTRTACTGLQTARRPLRHRLPHTGHAVCHQAVLRLPTHRPCKGHLLQQRHAHGAAWAAVWQPVLVHYMQGYM